MLIWRIECQITPGLELMENEMSRQCADALQTMNQPGSAVDQIVSSIKETGRLILYAMGGSQHVNRIVEPLYRELGIDARSMIASEQLLAPMPDVARTALIASQSGESGEIKQLLATDAGREHRFGLTLEANSTLARSVKASIVATGGTEHAFAATRSIVLTLAMHAGHSGSTGCFSGSSAGRARRRQRTRHEHGCGTREGVRCFRVRRLACDAGNGRKRGAFHDGARSCSGDRI